MASWGGLMLFNNAGIGSPPASVDETDVDVWLKVVAINLTGTALCARAAFVQMRSQSPQGGRIINNGSTSACPTAGVCPCCTKHGTTG